jgi:hypothetical protein
MVLFTKVYGELSLRIQQSLSRCNNSGAFLARRSARASRSGSPGQRDAEGVLVELGKSETNTLPCRIESPDVDLEIHVRSRFIYVNKMLPKSY